MEDTAFYVRTQKKPNIQTHLHFPSWSTGPGRKSAVGDIYAQNIHVYSETILVFLEEC